MKASKASRAILGLRGDLLGGLLEVFRCQFRVLGGVFNTMGRLGGLLEASWYLLLWRLVGSFRRRLECFKEPGWRLHVIHAFQQAGRTKAGIT